MSGPAPSLQLGDSHIPTANGRLTKRSVADGYSLTWNNRMMNVIGFGRIDRFPLLSASTLQLLMAVGGNSASHPQPVPMHRVMTLMSAISGANADLLFVDRYSSIAGSQ